MERGAAKMTTGEQIYARRKELDLTMEDIAKAVGVAKSTVKKWESGDIKNMRTDKLKKLADVLKVSVSYLLPNNDEVRNEDSQVIEDTKPMTEHAFECNSEVFSKLSQLAQIQAKYDKTKKSTDRDTRPYFIIKMDNNDSSIISSVSYETIPKNICTKDLYPKLLKYMERYYDDSTILESISGHSFLFQNNLSDEENELLSIYRMLSERNRIKLRAAAFELEEIDESASVKR